MRFIDWQLTQKLVGRAVEYPFIGNTKLWVKKGMTGATGNIYTGLHDFEDMGFLLHFLRPEDLFIDIGANIGSYTILAAGATGASCIAVEPVLDTFQLLEKNISINQLQNKVTALNIGVGAEKSTLLFTRHLDTVNHVIPIDTIPDDDTQVQVDCLPLDDLLIGKPTPALLKIDVEGFEQPVLTGAANLLHNTGLKAIIIELNGSGGRYGFDEKKIHKQLLAVGFNCYSYKPFERKLIPSESFGSFNTIYARDMDYVNARLKTAPAFRVFSENI